MRRRVCKETRDKARLRRVFERHSAESLYLWADLSEPFFSQCRWLMSEVDGDPESVVLDFRGLSEPSLQSAGPLEGVTALLDAFAGGLPDSAWFKAPTDHVPAWRRRFALSNEEDLYAMSLAPEARVGPVTGLLKRWSRDDDASPLIRIYEDYPGNFFEASSLDANVYVSLVNEDTDEHVSVAGTHAVSREERVAVLGNITTRADHRGRGHATQCVSALVAALREMGCETIGLHVATENAAAIRCYEGLGFAVKATLRQARMHRVT